MPSYEEAVLETNTYVRHDRPQPQGEDEDRTREYLPQAARGFIPIVRPPYRESEQAAEQSDRGFGRGRRYRSPQYRNPVSRGVRPVSSEGSPDSRIGSTFEPRPRWRAPQHSTPEEPRSPERPAPEEDQDNVERGPRVETSASTSVASEPIGPSLPPSPYDIFADSLHLFEEQECWDDATSDSSTSYDSGPPDLETASLSDEPTADISYVGRLIAESKRSLKRGLLLALLNARAEVGSGPRRGIRAWVYLVASVSHLQENDVIRAWQYAFEVENAYRHVIDLVEGNTLAIFDLLGDVDPSVLHNP